MLKRSLFLVSSGLLVFLPSSASAQTSSDLTGCFTSEEADAVRAINPTVDLSGRVCIASDESGTLTQESGSTSNNKRVKKASFRGANEVGRLALTSGPVDRAGVTSGTGITSESGSLRPSFELQSGSDKTTATVTLNYAFGSQWNQDGDDIRVAATNFVAKASAPLTKNGDTTTLFEFDGAATGGKISGEFIRSTFFVDDGRGAGKTINLAATTCIQGATDDWFRARLIEADDTMRAKLKSAVNDLQQITAEIVDLGFESNPIDIIVGRAQNRQGETAKLATYVGSLCSIGIDGVYKDEVEFIEKQLGTSEADDFVDSFLGSRDGNFWGFGGSLGRDNLSFLDVENFKIVSDQNFTNFELYAFAGLIGAKGDWSLRGKLSRSKGYKQQPSAEFCAPVDGGPLERCLTGRNGPPKEIKRTLFSGEFRAKIGKSLAVAPQLTYDLKVDEFIFDLPIYFVPDEKGRLNGGLRIGYNSEKDDTGVAIFVGLPFSTFFR